MKITLKSLSSEQIHSESSKIMTPYGEQNRERVKILNEYNALVRGEAAAILKKDKAAEKEANKTRQGYLAKLKADGIALPRSAGHTTRLSVDDVLKGASKNKDFEKPSVLKDKEEGNVLVGNKFAKQILPMLSPETSKKLASLDKSDQVTAITSVKDHLAKLKDAAKGSKAKELETLLAKKKLALSSAIRSYKKAKENGGSANLAKSNYLRAKADVARLKNSLDFFSKRADDSKAVIAKMDNADGRAKVIDTLTSKHVDRISTTSTQVMNDRRRRLTKGTGRSKNGVRYNPVRLTQDL